MKQTNKLNNLLRDLYNYILITRSGLFDKDYYRHKYLFNNQKSTNPLWHFIRFGWRNGHNPSANFNTDYYLNAYPDVKQLKINPLRHYISFGQAESRATRPVLTKSKLNEFLQTLKPVENGTVFIIHETSRTGAPINLLHLVKAYNNNIGDNYVILSMAEGDYLDTFKQHGNFLSFSKTISFYTDEITHKLFQELNILGYTKCIANTIFTGIFADLLIQANINAIFLINELPETINSLSCSSIAIKLSKAKVDLVFPSQKIADLFSSQFGVSYDHVHIVPQSIRLSMRYEGDKNTAKKEILTKLNLNIHNKTNIVLGAGRAQYLKGTDLFVEVVAKVYQMNALDNVHFLWLGEHDAEFKNWTQKKYHKLLYKSHLHFLKFEEDPAYLFAGSDVYLLTSRQDTYPSTALEALANNTPVIMFSGTGGIEDILDEDTGIAVPYPDTQAIADELLKWLNKEKIAVSKEQNDYTYQDYLHKLIMILKKRNHKRTTEL